MWPFKNKMTNVELQQVIDILAKEWDCQPTAVAIDMVINDDNNQLMVVIDNSGVVIRAMDDQGYREQFKVATGDDLVERFNVAVIEACQFTERAPNMLYDACEDIYYE